MARQLSARKAQKSTAPGRKSAAVAAAIASVNPATGQTLRTFTPLSREALDARLGRAAIAFRSYRERPFTERASMMKRVADILDEEKTAFGRLMTTEMGKPLKAAMEEAAKCAWACRYYAEHAEALLADELVETGAARSFVRYQPQCALAIEALFTRAGFGEGVFQTLLIGTDEVARVLADERVAAVTLTGSERAGRAVAGQAGANIKKAVLELGGSDPFIVMPSADLDAAVATAVKARTINNGQSCIAAKRFIVAEAIADEFERRFVRGMSELRVGDPLDPTTDVGPLATAQGLATLEAQVERSVAAGARRLLGGARFGRPGNYYPPTVLTDVPRDSPAYREELFGPVAVLLRAADATEAIRIANDTTFGLGASVWTRDEAERARFVEEIEAGMVFINAMVASDPRLPFGGVKRSGFGRELGVYGLREFVNVKTVWINDGAARRLSSTE